jgi:outer membrane protein TolC
LELSKLIDQNIQVKAMRQRERVKLNILMNRPVGTEISIAREIQKNTPPLLADQKLYKMAENNRPLLKQFESNIDAARARLDLANKEYYPDITLTVTYGDRVGSNPMPMGGARSDMLSVMVGVKVPLYFGSKQSKSISQKSKELQKNRYSLIDVKSRVFGEIASQRIEYQRSSEQINLFTTGIIPLAKQSVNSMLVGYKVGDVDFLSLIKSQVTLFNYELQYWKSLSEARQSLAHIEAAVGGESIYE